MNIPYSIIIWEVHVTQPALREVKVSTYKHIGLCPLGLTLSVQTPMQKRHTADEATLDGKIPYQDSVYVSNAKLKNWIKPKLPRDCLLEDILSSSAPPPFTLCQPWLASDMPQIGRERSREIVERYSVRERVWDIYKYI